MEAPPRAVLAKKYEDGLIVEEGDVIRLRLEFTGRPRPSVAWLHEGELIVHQPEGRRQVDIGADWTSLRVQQTTRADRGEYSVKLESDLGVDSASFLVTVASTLTYCCYFLIDIDTCIDSRVSEHFKMNFIM